MVRVEGSFTALDRKLWVLLLHHAWDELDTNTPFHGIDVDEVLRLFRKFGRGDLGRSGKVKFGKDEEETNAAALWQSVRRLVKTSVDWEDKNYASISTLISEALIDKEHRESGRILYSFGKILTQHILAPRSYARLRLHVVLALRSKYAVTLYEILEGYVNRREGTFTVTIDELRSWLKVPEASYQIWRDLRRFVLDPAQKEINEQGDQAGFFVAYEGIRKGKSFSSVKFVIVKTSERDERDLTLQRQARRARAFAASDKPSIEAYEPTAAVREKVRRIAPGWDINALAEKFRVYWKGKQPPKNPHGAFIGWVPKFTKGAPPS
jgi:hypothetical protein